MKEQLLIDDEHAADVSHVEPDVRTLSAPVATNPLMLLERAVEKGMSPDQLKALVELHEQWRAARAKEAFAAAMNLCQAEMPVIVRDAENNHTRSRYARLDGITHQSKPIYTAHGFALSFSEAESNTPNFKRIVCQISHREGHTERHWLDLPIDGKGSQGGSSSMNAVQGCISTGSYGQRVLICRIFNVTIADTDLDGVPPPEHDNPPPSPNAPKAQPRAQRQPPVSREQCAELLAAWKTLPGNQSEPSGDNAKWNGRFFAFVCKTTGRDFDAGKSANWTREDYEAVDRALTALEAK